MIFRSSKYIFFFTKGFPIDGIILALTFARELAVVFAAALVAAHDAFDVLAVFIALAALQRRDERAASLQRTERAAGLRAGRARRRALLRLLQVVSATAATAGRVPPRRRHQSHAPGEPAEIVVMVSAAARLVERHAVRRSLEGRRRGRAADRTADARHARTAAAAASRRRT